jgi:hypothetical protein
LNMVEVAIMNNPMTDPALKTFLQENRHKQIRNPFNVMFLPKFRQMCDLLAHPTPTLDTFEQALRQFWDVDKGRKRLIRDVQNNIVPI